MNMNIPDTTGIPKLQAELWRVRGKQELTEEDITKIIAIAQENDRAKEKDESLPSIEARIKLARTHDRQTREVLGQRPKIEPIHAQFNNLPLYTEKGMEAIGAALDEFEELCRDYLELEEITNQPLMRKYPPEYEIAGLPMAQAAESIAIQERHRLGLGNDGPIPLLRDMLEQDVGLRIFYLPLYPIRFSAVYHYADELGSCMLINGLYAEDRRRWWLAHEYAHFLVHRRELTAFTEEGYHALAECDFAEAFARFFLVPTTGLLRRFNDLHQMEKKIAFVDLCTLSHYYGVPVPLMILRLEEAKLLPSGTWEKLRASGERAISPQLELELLAADTRSTYNKQLPIRYQYLALDALDRALIGEGRFTHFLGVDRVRARAIGWLLRQSTQGFTDDTIININMAELLDM